MARKKRKSKGKAAKRRPRSKAGSQSAPPLPDRRAMEGVMQHFLSGLAGADDPLDRAQEIIYQAFEASGPRQAQLAKKALTICPDCADAYVLLAEHAPTLSGALDLYQQGVAAGERALGQEAFREYEGQFWGFLETRPYMRARHGLANCLWTAGRREEAVGHYREMLRLNPNDNQGVRYVLAPCLFELDRDDELADLLHQYEGDASAEWGYASALLAYRQEGDSPRARKMLDEAMETNRHVPDYLVGNKPVPRQLPPYVSFGGEDEAVSYAAGSLPAWKDTPGAVSWLRKVLNVPLAPEPPPRSRPSWRRLKPALSELPQVEGEIWQVAVRGMKAPDEDAASASRHWVLLIANRTDRVLLETELHLTRPGTADVWQCLVEAMLRPDEGEPHRPEQIDVRLKTYQTSWGSKLQQIGIQCLLRDELPEIESMFDEMASFSWSGSRSADTARGELEQAATDLSELPQRVGEVWQADVRRLPTWIRVEGQPQRPWAALVANIGQDLILANDLTLDQPAEDWLWTSLAQAIGQPAAGDPHRPGVIQVGSQICCEALEPHLEAAGIECLVCERLDELDLIFEDLIRHLSEGDPMPALVEVPGLDPLQVGSFFEAAAEFYRRKPWRDVPGDVPIQVECSKFESGTWYAVVMGQSGVTLGLAMYEDAEVLGRLLAGEVSDEEHARRTSALSFSFGEEFELAPRDLDAAEQNAWPVAGPEAYPCAMRVKPGAAVRPPLAWELELLEGCLRAIPDFLTEEATSQRKTVPVTSGELELRLSWLEEGPC